METSHGLLFGSPFKESSFIKTVFRASSFGWGAGKSGEIIFLGRGAAFL